MKENDINTKTQFIIISSSYFCAAEQFLIILTMPSSHFSPESIPDLTGRVYVVTGGNAGM